MFHRNIKLIRSKGLHSGCPFSPSINGAPCGTHLRLDEASALYYRHQSRLQSIGSMTTTSYPSQLHLHRLYETCWRSPRKGDRRRDKRMIDHTNHRIINRPLHRAYHKLTARLLPKYSKHRMFICHWISKAHFEAGYNLRITTGIAI